MECKANSNSTVPHSLPKKSVQIHNYSSGITDLLPVPIGDKNINLSESLALTTFCVTYVHLKTTRAHVIACRMKLLVLTTAL